MWFWFFNWFVKITGWIPQRIIFKTKVYYENKKIQGRHIKGKAIVISNHLSVFDIAMMMQLFPSRTMRPLIAEIMYKKNALFSLFLNALGGIKVDRNSHDFSFIEKSCKLLEKGKVVEIYPEARLPKKNEPRPLPFTPSAFYIALLSGAPIIPVYTDGQYFTKARSKVMIGTPIDIRELYNDEISEQENLKNISEHMRNKIIGLENELKERTKNEKN